MSSIIEMRKLAVDGLVILSDEAYSRYKNCHALVEQELALLKEDIDRTPEKLCELLRISESLWDEYWKASTDVMEAYSALL